MRAFLLPVLLFSGIFGFAQVSKKNTTAAALANVAGGLYAVMPASPLANGQTLDTTYLSSSDFTGTGTVADPIRIKTAVIQTWLQSLPGFSANGSKYLAADFTWKTIPTTVNSITSLNAPSLTATAVNSSTVSLSWTDVANETSYLLQRSQDNASWLTVAQLAANTTQFTNSGLSPSTLYYYRIKAVGDNTTYADSPFSSGSTTTSSGGGGGPVVTSAETVLFDIKNAIDVQQHSDGPGTYYSSKGNGIAQALKKLPAGVDGVIYFQYQAGTGELLSLGYTTENNLQGYEYWAGGVYLFGTEVKAYGYNGSTTGLGVTAVNNQFYGFRRNGSMIEIVTSADEVNWTVLGYTNYSADDLYLQIYFQTATEKIKVSGRNLVSY